MISLQKSVNISLVMKSLLERPLTSRSAIAERVGLDKSTLTNLVSELTDAGLVEEVKEGASAPRGGRKPRYLRINPEAFRILGVDLSVEGYRLVLINPAGEITMEKTVHAPADPENFPGVFSRILGDIKQECRGSGTALAGIGIGIPGFARQETGTVILSRSLGMEDYPVAALANPGDGISVLVENDANCCTWGELHNPGHKSGDLLFLLVRFYPEEYRQRTGQTVGVGMGIALNGAVHRGHDHRAGEFRSYRWRSGFRDSVGIETGLLEAIGENEEVLRRFIIEVMENLSVLAAALRPETIVIGGDLRRSDGTVRRIIREELADRWIGSSRALPGLKISRYGENDIAAGAALMYLNRLYAVPGPEDLSPRVPGWHSLMPLLKSRALRSSP
jgi:predicted NBD/HSP70 family sugar kinase